MGVKHFDMVGQEICVGDLLLLPVMRGRSPSMSPRIVLEVTKKGVRVCGLGDTGAWSSTRPAWLKVTAHTLVQERDFDTVNQDVMHHALKLLQDVPYGDVYQHVDAVVQKLVSYSGPTPTVWIKAITTSVAAALWHQGYVAAQAA